MPDWISYIAAIKVSGGQTNADDPSTVANLQGWWSSGSGVYQDSSFTIQCTGGDTVGGWRDKSMAGNDLFQTNTTNYPAYIPVGSGMNLQPVLNFDGINDSLIKNDGNNVDGQTDYTCFAVLIRNSTGGNQVLFQLRASNDGPQWSFRNSPLNNVSLFQSNVALIGSANTVIVADATARLLAFSYSSAGQLIFYLNGQSDGLTENAQTFAAGSIISVGAAIGNTVNCSANIAEMLYYNRVLSDSERNTVETYLNTVYSIY